MAKRKAPLPTLSSRGRVVVEPRQHIEFSCHCEGERSEAVAIAKSLDNNEITTSCAAHTPRNDMKIICHPEAIAEGSQKVNEMLKQVQHDKNFGSLCKVQDDKYVSKAHSKHLFPYSPINLFTFKKAAFTLAEVLITLAIIGVVAAMTIPTLIANYKEKQTVTQLAKVFSILSSAYQMVQAEYGPVTSWGLSDTKYTDENGEVKYNHDAQALFAQRMQKYLRVSKVCTNGSICYPYASYTLHGTKLSDPAPVNESESDSPASARFFLNDGTYIAIGHYGRAYEKIDIAVVLPGNKSVLGKSRFYFGAYKNGIVPEGMPGTNTAEGWDLNCNPDVTHDGSGRGCAAWVIYNKNMDYLHCRDKLSWDGAHSCKEAE